MNVDEGVGYGLAMQCVIHSQLQRLDAAWQAVQVPPACGNIKLLICGIVATSRTKAAN
jgi:hypothetical protein